MSLETTLAELEKDNPKAPGRNPVNYFFTVFGQPCRLIQLVPNAFVMRMPKALDELGAEYLGEQAPTAAADSAGLDESMREIQVRV